MPAYRAYFLDRADHISGTEIIEAVSLRDAVHAAMALLHVLPDDQTIELWRAENMVCSLPPSTYVRRAHRIAHARDSEPATSRDLRKVVSRLADAREAGQAA
jgi:hypothetical protein